MTTGAVLLAVCLLLLTGQRQLPAAFGALPAAAPAGSSAMTAVPPSTAGSTAERSVVGAGPTPAAAARVGPPSTGISPSTEIPVPTATPAPTPSPAAPLTVSLPGPGVSAPVVELLAADGVLHPPEDPAVVGWWAASALVGATSGSTVLVGHVDSAQAGLGALAGLSELTAGSPVEVTTESGTTGYTVTALLVLDKGAGLPADLFTRTGPPRLVLITCGGPFDEATLSYRDNVVVIADPA
ncbi:hypothetical protein J2S58_002062 [Nakamurella flavida]|uniref:class F sortase n=1 Tax=Nakamurella flavida TaxID=363630 RepID=UPI002788DD2C|nr:class F sortase [Nakamurella flavida]MDP9778439.1 hypothetical protein [Nakamurella flavida]